MKYFPLIVLILISQPLFSQDSSIKQDYIPKPVDERAISPLLLDRVPKNAGIISSSTLTLLNTTLTVYNAYNSVEYASEDLSGESFQRSIVFTGLFLITTTVFSLILKYFISRE